MAFLKFLTGARTGEVLQLDQDATTMGRSPDCVITLDDGAISSRHCCVLRDGKKYSLNDFDSTNGTRLNGEYIKDTPLRPKDVIRVGDLELEFDGDDVDAPPAMSEDAPRTIITTPQGAPASFGHKQRRTGLWILIGAVVGVGILGLAYWFVRGLL